MKHFLLKFSLIIASLFVGVGCMWAEAKTLTLDKLGSSLGSTSNTSMSTVNITATGTSDSYTLNYLQGKKQGDAILLAKNKGAFIANSTAMPGDIKSVTVYINSGASGKTTYHCAFTSTACIEAITTGSTAVNIAGGNSNKYTCSTSGNKYFCVSLGNDNNGQVLKLEIEYETSGGGGSTPTALSAPTNLSSSNVTTTGATLSWDEVANASSYTVKIGEQEYTGVNTNSYSATGLTAGTQYTWTVKAVGDGTNYTTSDYAANANFTTESEQGGGSGEGGGSSSSIYTYKKVTSQSDIVYGGTYLIVCEDENTAMGSQNSAKTRRNNAAITINNNTIRIDKVNEEGFPYEVTLGSGAGEFTTMKLSNEYFLGNGSGSSNQLKEVQTYAAGYGWILTYKNGIVTMKTNQTTQRYLCINTSFADDSYATYTSDSNYEKVTLYKKQTAPAGPTKISNLIKTSSADLYVGDEIDNLKTYLNLPNDYEGTVTFSSEQDGTLITLAEEMLSADAVGTATINVTAAANGNYLETEGTITLNISKKTPVLTWDNSKTSYTIFNLADNNTNKFVGQTATATEGATVKYTITGTGATIDEDGIVTITGEGVATITASTEGTPTLNEATPITYTLNIVNPSISMTPISGTASEENPTVTFTGNGVSIAYMDDEANENQKTGTSISTNATKTSTYYVTIYDDAENEFEHDFDVFVLQNPGLAFAGATQTVSMDAEPFAALALTNPHDLTVTYSMEITNDLATPIATIAPETGVITLSGKAATTAERRAYVVASTEATDDYAAGEVRYELIINKRESNVAWSANEVTVDFDEVENLPTLSNPRNLTITYDSSNKDVATISNEGEVTLLAAGTTIISASIGGSAYYDAATYEYTLTVAPKYTVTFKVSGQDDVVLREETCGAGVTAPEVVDVADYTFAGWKAEYVDTETTDAQTFVTITDGKYIPTESTTLYAVYKRVEEGEGVPMEITITKGSKNMPTAYAKDSEGNYKTADYNLEGVEFSTLGLGWFSGNAYFQFAKGTDNGMSNKVPFTAPVQKVSITVNNLSYLANVYAKDTYTSDGVIINGVRQGITKEYVYDFTSLDKSYRYITVSNANSDNTVQIASMTITCGVPSTTYYTSTPVLEVATISVSQFQNTTLCLSRAYTMPEGLVGKTVSAKEGSDGKYTLTLTQKYEAGAVVPAGEALVVQGEQGTYNAIAAASSDSKTAYPDNLLVAEYTKQDSKFLTSFESESSNNYYYYKLTTKGGANFGWYYGAEGGAPFQMSSKERAYLVIAKDVAAGIRGFVLSDMENNLVTDIHDMKAIAKQETIYNLQGLRMQKMQRGINIVNGKKFIR